jgi:predicted aspartyl protease
VKVAFVAGLTLLATGSVTCAEPSALAKACAANVQEFCADVTPGAGKVTACIKSHFKDLSGDCQVAFIRVAAVGRACRDDIAQVCADMEGAVPDCLRSRASQVSAGCKEAIAKAKEAGDGSSGPPPTPQVTQPKSTGVALQTEGGTFVVPVLVNEAIKLNFVIDSGSADVSIPADVVMTLIRTGTIGQGDFRGSTTYKLADGSRIPATNFNIKSLKVGNITLRNVMGSVA